MKKIELGQIVMTNGVDGWMKEDHIHPATYLTRHERGDWGDVCKEDRAANDRALDPKAPERIMSVYDIDGKKLWIITEWDRSVTTLLLPEEY